MYIHITKQENDFLYRLFYYFYATIYFWIICGAVFLCVLKLVSELHGFIWAGIAFQRDARGNEKLVLKRSILILGRVMNRDVARVLKSFSQHTYCIYVLFPMWNPWWQSTTVQQQASVFGPVQFTLYFQPLSDLICRQECDYHKYADDTQLSKAAPADQ